MKAACLRIGRYTDRQRQRVLSSAFEQQQQHLKVAILTDDKKSFSLSIPCRFIATIEHSLFRAIEKNG
jgi:hypothetical protein